MTYHFISYLIILWLTTLIKQISLSLFVLPLSILKLLIMKELDNTSSKPLDKWHFTWKWNYSTFFMFACLSVFLQCWILTSTCWIFGCCYMLKNEVQRELPSIENMPRTLCSIFTMKCRFPLKGKSIISKGWLGWCIKKIQLLEFRALENG